MLNRIKGLAIWEHVVVGLIHQYFELEHNKSELTMASFSRSLNLKFCTVNVYVEKQVAWKAKILGVIWYFKWYRYNKNVFKVDYCGIIIAKEVENEW